MFQQYQVRRKLYIYTTHLRSRIDSHAASSRSIWLEISAKPVTAPAKLPYQLVSAEWMILRPISLAHFGQEAGTI
jgi:hypothetical protein